MKSLLLLVETQKPSYYYVQELKTLFRGTDTSTHANPLHTLRVTIR